MSTGTEKKGHLRVIGFPLSICPAIKQAQAGAVVVEGADVADKGGGVHYRGLTLPQDVVSVRVPTFLYLESLPLGEEEGATVFTALDTSGAVHWTAAWRTRVNHKARIVRRFTAVLPSVDVNKAPFLVLVAADIADLGEGILVWEGEVKDVC